MNFYKLTTTVFLIIVLVTGCSGSDKAATVYYGSDECSHCKMAIADNRFASQLVTETGKALKFDAIECLAAYSNAHHEKVSQAKALWVSQLTNPGEWLKISQATIVQGEQIKSPMGLSLAAFATKEQAEKFVKQHKGKILSWEQVMDTVEKAWKIKRP